MNNNEEIKFNPETGEPIQPIEQAQPKDVQSKTMELAGQVNSQTLQSVPNVEQNETKFISNIEDANKIEKKNNKKDDLSAIIIGTIFVLVLLAILFLFPYLKNI